MQHFNRTITFCLLLTLGVSSCDLLVPKNEDNIKDPIPVARVYDTYLYKKDLEGLKISTADSTDIINRYIKKWVNKKLMITEAGNNIEFDEAEIERKILDYRFALMVYEFEKYYINKKLNKTVNDIEIQQYYNTHKDNFELKQNIIKGKYIKLRKNAPKMDKVRKWIQSSKEKDAQNLQDYCFSFATSYNLEDSVWINFDDIVQYTPMASIPNKVQFLKRNKYMETSDEEFTYYLLIKDYIIKDELSPLEFVSHQITNVIINSRKIILAQQLEKNILEQAEKNNDFEIYSTK